MYSFLLSRELRCYIPSIALGTVGASSGFFGRLGDVLGHLLHHILMFFANRMSPLNRKCGVFGDTFMSPVSTIFVKLGHCANLVFNLGTFFRPILGHNRGGG